METFAISVDEQPRQAESRVSLVVLAAVGVFFAWLLYRYFQLFPTLFGSRGEAFLFYGKRVLPVALAHTALFAVIFFFRKGRLPALLGFWGASLAVLMAIGGVRKSAAIVAAFVFAFLLVRLGRLVNREVLDSYEEGWEVDLPLGVAAMTVIASFLAFAHILTPWTIVAVLGFAFVASYFDGSESAAVVEEQTAVPEPTPAKLSAHDRKKQRRKAKHAEMAKHKPRNAVAMLRDRILDDVVKVRDTARARVLDAPTAFVLQTLFLIGIAVIIWASYPEWRSDAIRVYWPYIRLMDKFDGIIFEPSQFGYVVPQAGVPLAASVYALFGSMTAHFTMVICFVATAGLVYAMGGRRGLPSLALIAITVATPALVMLGSSIMQDSLPIMVVVLIAFVALRTDLSSSVAQWGLLGALVGLGWTAKYTTIVFAAPFCGWALVAELVRMRRFRFGRSLVAGSVLALAALAVTAPWLWHAWKSTGNPTFPLLNSIFPTVWATRAANGNLDMFMLAPGWKSWLTAPWTLTFETSKYLEGLNGAIGLSLLVVLTLAIVGAFRRNLSLTVAAASAIFSMLVLMKQTAYVRYWLPAIWLLVPLAGEALAWLLRSKPARWAAAAFAALIVILQIPVAMASVWAEPSGLPWRYFRGETTHAEHLEALPGFEALRDLQMVEPDYPRVLFTAAYATGHWRFRPIEVNLWEIRVHGAATQEQQIRYIENLGADYWIVNYADQLSWVLAPLGKHFWRDEYLVTSEGSVFIYRLPKSERGAAAAAALRKTDRGIPLLKNGSFETSFDLQSPDSWNLSGTAKWKKVSDAARGERVLAVNPTGNAIQAIALPVGATGVRLSQSIRVRKDADITSARMQINWGDAEGKPLGAELTVVPAFREWKRYSMRATIPAEAKTAIIYMNIQAATGEIEIDDVELEVF